jgi:hypothetical protein
VTGCCSTSIINQRSTLYCLVAAAASPHLAGMIGASPGKEMRWIRHLPSIIASSLLFGFIGTPAMTVLLLIMIDMESAGPGSVFGGIDEFVLIAILYFTAVFIAPPAFAIGAIAGTLRIHMRSIFMFACAMSVLAGAAALGLVLVVPFDLLSDGSVILASSATAFGCSFLLWRNRPWTIRERSQPAAQSGNSLQLRYRRMRVFWEWEP